MRLKNFLVIDRERFGEKLSCPPDERTNEKYGPPVVKCPRGTDRWCHSFEAWVVCRLSGSRKHLRVRRVQVWGFWVAGGAADGGSIADGEESVVTTLRCKQSTIVVGVCGEGRQGTWGEVTQRWESRVNK